MRCAILTDIHANRAAFDAVLRDIAHIGAQQIAILGDMVGLGPDPAAVLDVVQELAAKGAWVLRGNHDRIAPTPPDALNAAARKVVDWTYDRLTARERLFLADLPLTIAKGDMLFVHASAHNPADWAYIDGVAQAKACFAASPARITFAGHLHRAGLYSLDGAGQAQSHDMPPSQPIYLAPNLRWLAVVPPVSLPRDGHIGAQYCSYDSETCQLTRHTVGYDAGQTAQRAKAVTMPLARRLGR